MIDEKLFGYLYEKAKSAILGIDDKEVDDIYAISFLLDCLDDDLRRSSFIVGYNTETYFKSRIKDAWDEDEARWNYAFWLQNELTVLGGDDPVFQKWVRHCEDYYTDEEDRKKSKETEKKSGCIHDTFIDAGIEIVKRLHSEEIVLQRIGRELPILVHELEYYNLPIGWTKKANPKKLIAEFLDWYKNM